MGVLYFLCSFAYAVLKILGELFWIEFNTFRAAVLLCLYGRSGVLIGLGVIYDLPIMRRGTGNELLSWILVNYGHREGD